MRAGTGFRESAARPTGDRRAGATADRHGPPPQELLEFRDAPGRLGPLIESFYLYRSDRRNIAGVERVDLAQLRFILRGDGFIDYADGRSEAACPVMLTAPGTAASRYRVAGPFHCFGASLRPVGWRALFGRPAHRVADRVIDASGLLGEATEATLAALRGADTLDAMVAIVTPLLEANIRPVPRSHVAVDLAIRRWIASEAPVIDDLFASIPMSRRQVTRLCNEYFGASPKYLERKYRAIRAAMLIYEGAPLDEAAARFADQSHMINEIRHFTGHTPTALRSRIDPVMAVTFDRETFHIPPKSPS